MFKKGKPKTGGKSKGTPNKRTVEAVKRIEYVLSILEENIESDISDLEPNERIKMWADLQEYIRPKLARTELTGKDGTPLIPITTVEIVHAGAKDTGE